MLGHGQGNPCWNSASWMGRLDAEHIGLPAYLSLYQLCLHDPSCIYLCVYYIYLSAIYLFSDPQITSTMIWCSMQWMHPQPCHDRWEASPALRLANQLTLHKREMWKKDQLRLLLLGLGIFNSWLIDNETSDWPINQLSADHWEIWIYLNVRTSVTTN